MSKAATLVDNFNDNSLDTVKWVAVGDPLPITDRAREVNGRIEITPRSGEGPRNSGFRSVGSYDLLDSYAHVELVQTPRPHLQDADVFSGRIDGGTIAFNYQDGYMECFQDVGTVTTLLYKAPYDPVAHRWLRLRETQGTTFWEVSPDGRAWTVLVSKPDPILLTHVYFYLEVGVRSAIPSPGMAIYDNFNVIDTSRSRRIEERRRSALDVRVEAAEVAAARPHPEHMNNNDEVNYGSFIGNYSKSLKRDSLGDPDPKSYGTLLRALQSEDPADFEEIELSTVSNPMKLTNPQSGLAFDIAGPDPQEMTMKPAPRFESDSQGVLRRIEDDRESRAGKRRWQHALPLREPEHAAHSRRRAQQTGGQHRPFPRCRRRALAYRLHRIAPIGRVRGDRSAPGDEPRLQRG